MEWMDTWQISMMMGSMEIHIQYLLMVESQGLLQSSLVQWAASSDYDIKASRIMTSQRHKAWHFSKYEAYFAYDRH